jgi:hypothetical protein
MNRTKVSTKVRVAPRFKTGMTATSDYAARLAPFDQKTLALWAADCAQHVLPHFETLHPTDDRPRRAIEAARTWARGEITMMMARAAAVKTHAAARESDHPAAVAAARAAGHAAGTAHSIRHARGAAAYAIVSAVAATTGDEHDSAATAEREWQIAKLPTSNQEA